MTPLITKRIASRVAILVVLLLTSCGEIFDTESLIPPTAMRVHHNDITIMTGDSVRISLIFSPRSLTVESAFRQVDNPSVARITSNGMLHAMEVGETEVSATTVQSLLKDVCHINIINSWEDILNNTYPYDMIVYADVRHNGEVPDNNTIIAAFCGNECRGFGRSLTHKGIRYYTFRIWSPQQSGELIEFYLYDRTEYRLVRLDYSLTFDGETHGSLSNLIRIDW